MDLQCRERSYYLDFFLVILKLQGGPKSDEIWRIFRPHPQTFCSHAGTRQNIVILKKNLLSTDGTLHVMPRFVNFGVQTPDIHATHYCSLKVIGCDMFYFHSQDGSTVGTVGFDMCIRQTRLFLSRVSILTSDIDIANLSVRPLVRPSVTFRYHMKTA